MTTQAVLDPQQTGAKEGQYLTFMLGDGYYGLEVRKVREIVAMMDITPVPRTQPYICGVVNLRGHVIPVMDLRLKLGLPAVESNPRTCIIVVSRGDSEIGMIVDKVCDVTNIAGADIDDTSWLGDQIDRDLLLGIGKEAGRVTVLLDGDAVFSNSIIQQTQAL
jgi:purine-binding chemotaxis protein CheW